MKTIVVDFDGVIHGYSKGWHNGTIYDPPKENCREILKGLSKKFSIIIFSVRCFDRVYNGTFQKSQIGEVGEYLRIHDIPHKSIYVGIGKPHADYYIDDNAIRFESWIQVRDFIDEDSARGDI